MRKIFLQILFTFLYFSINAQEQLIGYQAVIRKMDNSIVSNQDIGIKVSILLNSINGNTVYSESHKSKTNLNGLISIEIGNGQNKVGLLSEIDWLAAKFFVKTEYDLLGGTNYTLNNTSQLLTTPVALAAYSAKRLTKHYIGEFHEGGIIFHVYNDQNGIEHGLIMMTENITENSVWSNVTTELIGNKANNSWDGIRNILGIINQSGHSTSAAQLCDNLNFSGFSDWYLPSLDELNLMYSARYEINRVADIDNDPSTVTFNHYDYLWSSTEAKSGTAWLVHFAVGESNTNSKANGFPVRAIRKF